LTEATHRALKQRAAEHGRSAEAEMRDILETAVLPHTRLRLGSALAESSRRVGVTNADIDALDQTRNKAPAKPMSFE
jgi:plasmid stability protein